MEEYAPKARPYQTFLDDKWRLVRHQESRASESGKNGATPAVAILNLRIITWNIDFMAPRPPAWMASALADLQDIVDSTPESMATVIMPQEMEKHASLGLMDLGRRLPPEYLFKDAYLELGGKEDGPYEHAWAPQSRTTRFPHKRMDKICFCQQYLCMYASNKGVPQQPGYQIAYIFR